MKETAIPAPNANGFITHWLVSGPALTTPEVTVDEPNQLKFEKDMRAVIADDRLPEPPAGIAAGADGLPGCPWTYAYAGENWFIDVSAFYHLLTKVELYGATVLRAPRDMRLTVRVWTFAAVDLFVNGKRVLRIPTPVYKPINHQDTEIELQAGDNPVFLRMQNLGVRDTRNIVGLQLRGDFAGVTSSLPGGPGALDAVVAADRWLSGIRYAAGELAAVGPMPDGAVVKVEIGKPGSEETGMDALPRTIPWNADRFPVNGGEGRLPVGNDAESLVLTVTVGGQRMTRTIEAAENMRPSYAQPHKDLAAHRKAVIAGIANLGKGNLSSGKLQYHVYFILARLASGMELTDQDRLDLRSDMDLVGKRIDCADFLTSGLLRLALRHPDAMDAGLQARLREVCLDFRYWMDEDGADGMCFWSENHALLFYSSRLVAGICFPDVFFVRSGRTGREQELVGARRCAEWLDSVERTGFEEFLSGGYMCVTAAALLNVIDFGSAELSARATAVLTRLLSQLSLHTFHGCAVGPQGRVYRDVFTPFRQGIQGLVHYINPSAAVGHNMWVSAFASSTYRIPDELITIMGSPADTLYPCGNGEIAIRKTSGYILTSVSSPKTGDWPGWTNDVFSQSDPFVSGEFTYAYTKALNERYHGTTLFEPGVYGYQQHMWAASLDPDCLVFTNHPGGTHDKTVMRPGYWYGNGIMPAVLQQGNRIGVIYHLSDDHPVRFTHLYWPASSFAETVRNGSWVFGRKGESYIGVWSSGEMVPHSDILQNREFRVYDDNAGYYCTLSTANEANTFKSFMNTAMAHPPVFNPETRTLSAPKGFSLTFVEKYNPSQVI